MKSMDEKFYFSIFCFFDDLNRLKDFLNDLWTRYKLSTFNLIITVIITNNAFELVHHVEQDFIISFLKNDIYEKTTELYYMLIYFLHEKDFATRERSNDLLNTAWAVWDDTTEHQNQVPAQKLPIYLLWLVE